MSTDVQIEPVMKAVYAKLSGDGTLSGLVSGRFFTVQGPQDVAQPMVIVTPVTILPNRWMRAGAGDGADIDATFQIDVYGSAENQALDAFMNIQDRIIELLDCAVLTVTGYDHMAIHALDYGAVTREEDAWRVTSQWQLRATPTP